MSRSMAGRVGAPGQADPGGPIVSPIASRAGRKGAYSVDN